MYILPPVVLILVLSGALYKFREVWPEQSQYQAFQQQWGTRAELSSRETLDRTKFDPERGQQEVWMGEASGGFPIGEEKRGMQRGGGFQYGSAGGAK